MNETIYQNFARFYASEQYAQFSAHMLEVFPALQERYGLPCAGRLLDIACGNGTFGIGMAQQGWQVYGMDQSAAQLEIAARRAIDEAVAVDWQQGDMREGVPAQEFDMATCWFDSINYLLGEADWRSAFQAAYRALKPGGYYLFDMNTIYGIMVHWQSFGTTIENTNPLLLEIHRNHADFEHNLAHLHITIFEREPEPRNGEYLWHRYDEIHTEHALPVERVTALLHETGFNVLDVLGGVMTGFTEPRPDSRRVWFVCRKP
ncbi:MAG: class I SAM-dependent methyltransferase [Anaerolineae bacterium]|nr:class I SAM-dependent methyltransferase [Anaerolineae bacterium]